MDLLKETDVVGVVMQGSGSGNSYVETYKVQVGSDENNLRYLVNERGNHTVSGQFKIL